MAWEQIAKLDDITEHSTVRTELGGEPICVVRLPGEEVYAVHDTCSHQEYSLAEGFVEDHEIECALHGSMFNLKTGNPDSLPATKPIPTYAAKVDDGVVYVDVEQQLNDAPTPKHL
jgi:3-phenylpropionate/trans-cinnamate dioxygenase ferredoxin component